MAGAAQKTVSRCHDAHAITNFLLGVWVVWRGAVEFLVKTWRHNSRNAPRWAAAPRARRATTPPNKPITAAHTIPAPAVARDLKRKGDLAEALEIHR